MARGSTTTRRMGSPWGLGFLRRRAKEHLLRWGAGASGHPRPATRRAHDPNGWFCRNPFVRPGLRVELRSHPFGEPEQATPDSPEGLRVVRPLRSEGRKAHGSTPSTVATAARGSPVPGAWFERAQSLPVHPALRAAPFWTPFTELDAPHCQGVHETGSNSKPTLLEVRRR